MGEIAPNRLGLIAAVAAFAIWGLSPLLYKALADVPPLEVLAHRTLWSLVFIGAFALATGRAGRIVAALRDRRAAAMLTLSALLISANWFTFILAVQTGRATESSLGYYIFPLLSVVVGVAVLGERLSRAQAAAVALAALAVTTLAVGLGAAPWIALILAGTMTAYGYAKKTVNAGPITGVVVEVLILAPLALGWLVGAHLAGWTAFAGGGAEAGAFGRDPWTTALLMLAGLLTGGPLILFAEAAQRLRYATLGVLQYINPTLQFACAALIFAEPVTGWRIAAFAMIWTAVALYSGSALARDRSARRAARTASTDPSVA